MNKILIVEDNHLNRDMLCRRLTHRGFEVVSAASGQQGIALAHSESPDVILMDLSLPDISGWDVAAALKGDQATNWICIIALTAHAVEVHRRRALAAGCDDYDTKPVELDRLLNKIKVLLAKKGRASRTSLNAPFYRKTA